MRKLTIKVPWFNSPWLTRQENIDDNAAFIEWLKEQVHLNDLRRQEEEEMILIEDCRKHIREAIIENCFLMNAYNDEQSMHNFIEWFVLNGNYDRYPYSMNQYLGERKFLDQWGLKFIQSQEFQQILNSNRQLKLL